ncbi:MAG TPA: DNA adenine methylase [Chloroflexia bacterium]
MLPGFNTTRAKPFLKWAGGKTQLLAQMEAYFPQELRTGGIKRYIEPFIGGGAVFFHIAQEFGVEEFFILDINSDLILAYQTLKEAGHVVISRLLDMESKYHSLEPTTQSEFYYRTRSAYNKKKQDINYSNFSEAWVERTAQLIFLNRTCYNGLFRVNSKGEFNVPFGSYKNPTICNVDNLNAVVDVLQRTSIIQGDFTLCREHVNSETFVYFDPPYRPLTRTASFTSYSSTAFDDVEQLRLAALYKELSARRAKLLLSNSDPRNEDLEGDFFDRAYAEFTIERVSASRVINCNATKRGQITELLIMNY